MSKKIYEYEGKKYILVEDKGGDECERCALKEKCYDYEGLLCRDVMGIDYDETVDHRLERIADDIVSEEQAYEDYQERSTTAGQRGEQLAWAFIVLLAAQLISSRGFVEFYVGAACGLLYLLLSMLQSAWQSVAIWIVKNRIKRDDLVVSDYPEWVGFWAWVFYYAKIALLTLGTIYVASRFLSGLF